MVLPENFCRDAAEGEKEECFLREYKQSKRKGLIAFITVIVLLACVFVASFCIGRFSITPIRVLQSIGNGIKNGIGELSKWGTTEDTVVWLVRMPRICAAILVGSALTVTGATYQGLFRNPMVSPDILGASAGASVGACFMMLMNQGSAIIQAGAFLMGIGAVALSYFLSKAIGRGSNMILLLVLCGKLDFLIWISLEAMTSSVSTFVAQNYGAKKYERVYAGVRTGLLMSIAVIGMLSTILYFGSVPLGELFISSEDYGILTITERLMHLLAPFYTVFVFTEIFSAAMYGTGETFKPTIITLLGICVFRMLWIWCVVP
jgi:MATE efflux family protein